MSKGTQGQRKNPRGGSRLLASALVWFLTVGPYVGCAPGELRLVTDRDDDGGGATSSDDSDSLDSDSEGKGSTGGEDPQDVPPRFPCVLTDSCPEQCSQNDSDCDGCSEESDCEIAAPYCDASIGSCVECLDSSDCRDRFGSSFGACSAGRCVQCQRDRDCPGDRDCERGWCGTCDDKHDCPDDMKCEKSHCIPDFD